jgi:quercetin dioxygenase-like cupin family protein
MSTIESLPIEAHVAHQGEPRWFGGNLFEFLVPEEVTGGRITLFRATFRGGFGPPRHIHTREDEIFHILEGDVCFEIDGRRHLAGPGTSVWVPRGVPHGFRIESPVASLLGIIAPGEFENVFRNLSVPARERTLPPEGEVVLDIPALAAEQAARGTLVVGPPMEA